MKPKITQIGGFVEDPTENRVLMHGWSIDATDADEPWTLPELEELHRDSVLTVGDEAKLLG